MAAKQLWVRATSGLNVRPGEHRVLLFEKDDRHPGGEAFIAGPFPVRVADTAEVTRLLKNDQIEEVSDKDAKAFQSEQQKAANVVFAADRAVLDARAAEVASSQATLVAQKKALEEAQAQLARDADDLRKQQAAFERQKAGT